MQSEQQPLKVDASLLKETQLQLKSLTLALRDESDKRSECELIFR